MAKLHSVTAIAEPRGDTHLASARRMRPHIVPLFVFALSGVVISLGIACGGDSSSSPGVADAASGGEDAQTSTHDASTTTDSSNGTDAAAPSQVVFSYNPSWKGVKSVDVMGGFGQSSDWTAPLLSLKDDGAGTFTGTATLPAGQYAYVFKVTGDAAAAAPAMLSRYAIDPREPAFVACPAASPTFNKNDPNPCSQLTVPQAAAAPSHKVTGTVLLNAAPATGYLVVVEREEPKSHHFFADRLTTGADGTFTLPVAAGTWRLQVWHPTFLTQTDMARDPLKNDALRRAISGPFTVAADSAVGSVEMKYDGYAAMQPTGATGALPATFTFTLLSDAVNTRFDLYGPGASIGDPWFASAPGTATSFVYDGGFNTGKAPLDAGGVTPGTSYLWGTEQGLMRPEGGVQWTGQSMVFPVAWP